MWACPCFIIPAYAVNIINQLVGQPLHVILSFSIEKVTVCICYIGNPIQSTMCILMFCCRHIAASAGQKIFQEKYKK